MASPQERTSVQAAAEVQKRLNAYELAYMRGLSRQIEQVFIKFFPDRSTEVIASTDVPAFLNEVERQIVFSSQVLYTKVKQDLEGQGIAGVDHLIQKQTIEFVRKAIREVLLGADGTMPQRDSILGKFGGNSLRLQTQAADGNLKEISLAQLNIHRYLEERMRLEFAILNNAGDEVLGNLIRQVESTELVTHSPEVRLYFENSVQFSSGNSPEQNAARLRSLLEVNEPVGLELQQNDIDVIEALLPANIPPFNSDTFQLYRRQVSGYYDQQGNYSAPEKLNQTIDEAPLRMLVDGINTALPYVKQRRTPKNLAELNIPQPELEEILNRVGNEAKEILKINDAIGTAHQQDERFLAWQRHADNVHVGPYAIKTYIRNLQAEATATNSFQNLSQTDARNKVAEVSTAQIQLQAFLENSSPDDLTAVEYQARQAYIEDLIAQLSDVRGLLEARAGGVQAAAGGESRAGGAGRHGGDSQPPTGSGGSGGPATPDSRPAGSETDKKLSIVQKFFQHYGNKPDKSPLPDSIVMSREPSALKEKHRAFMRWFASLWDKVADHPNPYYGYDFNNHSLAEIDDKPHLASLAEHDEFGEIGLHKVLFGLAKVLGLADRIYKNQLKPTETYELYRSIEANMIDHLMTLKELGSGALKGGKYIQFGLQAIALHDPYRRSLYRPLLEDYLGTRQLNAMFGTKGDPKKYKGKELHKILVEEETKISGDAMQELRESLATFILEQDKKHGNSTNRLTKADALLIADSSIAVATFLEILPSMDNKDYVSQMFFTRFKYLEEYRRAKADNKDLGPIETLHFFRTLDPGLYEYFMSDGTSLEQFWLLAGCVSPEIQTYYGLPAEIDAASVKRNSDFSQNVGTAYARLGGFVTTMYEHIIGKKHLIDNWLGGSVAHSAAKIKDFNNAVIGYYFGDMERPAPEIRNGESEKDYYDRLKELRHRYAEKGYMLVRGYKIDPQQPGKFVSKDGGFTTNEKRAKVTYMFTPALTFFEIVPGDPKQWLELSLENPVEFQNKLEQIVGKNTFERIRLIVTKWFIIGELGHAKKEFRKKKPEERKEIIKDIFAGLNQDAFNEQYLTIGSRLAGEEVELSGFGRFSLDDIKDILKKSGMLRWIDIRLNIYVKFHIERLAKLSKFAGLVPEVRHHQK